MLEAALVRGLTEGGVTAVLTGMGPSPMLYFATHTLDVDGGIQVTGSHNPADYNGFKLLLNGRSVFGAEIQALGRRAAAGDWTSGNGEAWVVGDQGVILSYNGHRFVALEGGVTSDLDGVSGFIGPAGRYMIVTGEKSDTISSYAIDQHTGALKLVGKYPTGKGSNWIEIVAFD